MDYMDKWPSRMQGQLYFPKSGRVDKEHGFHPSNEGGVLGAGPNLGQM